MDIKYRTKKRATANNPQMSSCCALSSVKSKSKPNRTKSQLNDKRFNSQIIKPTYVPSPSKRKSQQSSTLYNLKTFSKQHIRVGSCQMRKEDVRLSKMPESQSLHSSIELKSMTPKQDGSKMNVRQEMQKFPHYVSKSYLMIQTKKKLLQAKHHIKLGRDCPILQSIEDSVNEDKTAFSRKMKLELCRKGNYDLIGYLQKDLEDLPDKSESKEKEYRGRNLPYLLNQQYKDPYTIERHERVQKMEEIKRKLKAVRKNNLSSLSRKAQ